MTDAPTLKPCQFCPFCGLSEAPPTLDAEFARGGDEGRYAVSCSDCRSIGPWRFTKELAIDAWNTRAAPKVKVLEWDVDGRRLRMDDTMRFSKGYDWDGFECLRQEGYGLGFGYIIWPDRLGGAAWNLYGTLDGLFVSGLSSEAEAKAAAQADFERRI